LDQRGEPPLDSIRIRGSRPGFEPVEVSVPIHQTRQKEPTILQLVAKAILQDLDRIEDSSFAARRRAEQLGIQYSVSSRWTTFLAIEKTTNAQSFSGTYTAGFEKLVMSSQGGMNVAGQGSNLIQLSMTPYKEEEEAKAEVPGELSHLAINARAAVYLIPGDHPDHAGWLNSLGVMLESRYKRTGAMADLEEAISVARQAVDATPADHPDCPGYLNNLGVMLESRYKRTRAMADLEEAIGVARQAVDATPAYHPDRAGRLNI
jgi:hypothetical protein